MNRNSKKETNGSSKEENLICPECGSVCIETSEEEYSFPYGIGEDSVNLKPRVPIRTCSDCGFSFLDHVGEGICHDAVCKHLGVMSPSQVKDLRKMYRLTQVEFAEITKLGPATLSRWERGIVIQNQAYDNYLYLLQFPENLNKLHSHVKSSSEEGELVETGIPCRQEETLVRRIIPVGSPGFLFANAS